jgi:pteridine reductase
VTGASRRLGRETALALAEDGWDVLIHHHTDRAGAERTAEEVVQRGRRAAVLRADLSLEVECRRLADEAHAALGGLELLVNNAGTFRRTPLETLSLADLDEQWAVGARAVFALSLFAGRRMKTEGRGAIVNLACASAERPWANFLPYSATKAAVVSLTRGFAKALAPEVRVNAVSPGPVLRPEGSSEAANRAAAERTLLGRWGQPADVAAAVVFLASAPYLTGVVLGVDGGRSIA